MFISTILMLSSCQQDEDPVVPAPNPNAGGGTNVENDGIFGMWQFYGMYHLSLDYDGNIDNNLVYGDTINLAGQFEGSGGIFLIISSNGTYSFDDNDDGYEPTLGTWSYDSFTQIINFNPHLVDVMGSGQGTFNEIAKYDLAQMPWVQTPTDSSEVAHPTLYANHCSFANVVYPESLGASYVQWRWLKI